MAIKLHGELTDADLDRADQLSIDNQAAAQEEVEQARANRVASYKQSAINLAEAAKISNIVERAKEIAGEIQFSDIKKVRIGDMVVPVADTTDTNQHIALDQLFKHSENRPRFDEFRGRLVDHNGAYLDDFYSGYEWLCAFNEIGLKKMKEAQAIEAVRNYAKRHRQNDLIVRLEKMIPQWDGKRRMRTTLIRIFHPHVTRLNLDFGQQFWLSLYGRCMMPGLDTAGLVLTLIGGIGCGKSLLGTRLVRIIGGDPTADSVQLDLGLNADGMNNFLRMITGQSIVANIGEMTGFNRGDMNKIKDVISRTSDKFHHKFEGVVHQPRQWITIMDSNRYEGLLKDDTGNRRFYPMFCGQLPHENGKPTWDPTFKSLDHVDMGSAQFENDVWQLLAEARAWFDRHGLEGYNTLTRKVSKAVAKFSNDQREIGAGIKNDVVANRFLPIAVTVANIKERPAGKGKILVDGRRIEANLPRCRVLYFADFSKALSEVAPGKVNLERADEELAAWGRTVGALDAKLTANMRALVFGTGETGLDADKEYVALKDFVGMVDFDKPWSEIAARARVDETRAKILSAVFGDDWENFKPGFGS